MFWRLFGLPDKLFRLYPLRHREVVLIYKLLPVKRVVRYVTDTQTTQDISLQPTLLLLQTLTKRVTKTWILKHLI